MKQSADSVRKAEDWPRTFAARLNAGKLADMLAMYDPEARLLAPPSGELITGHECIRPVLAGLIRSQRQLESHVVRSATIGDVAVLYTDFHGSTVGASGATREIRQHAIEVLRRQPDGTWKLVFGDPSARGIQPSPP
ncbi:MAG: YybH family protein [Steroidobacteraceae bacterium]